MVENIMQFFTHYQTCVPSLACASLGFTALNSVVAILVLLLAFKGARLLYFLPVVAFYMLHFNLSINSWIIFLAVATLFTCPVIRRNLLTRFIICAIKKLGLLPKISATEKIALTSGNSWVDGELFSGRPDFQYIFDQKFTQLTKEERDYLHNEVEEVCKMCKDYDVQRLRDLPPRVWKYLEDKKFFGMIIPKQYGGLGFSALGHSAIIEKLASRNVPLAITAMVPNSLGPAELLLHYGTKEQCDHYLPRLASGKDLPCFALTETGAGSDATSIQSNGVVFKDKDGEIKIKLNWKKRYITLGAVATVIGVAFRLHDPDKLIGDNEDIGITCALIPSKTKGVIQGRRHDPLATPFVNSPIDGKDVIVGLDAIIGGKKNAGKGWQMLMESLAAGRGISLPSTSCGGMKMVLRAVGGYSGLRQQFGTVIGKFEGIEEVLARIAYQTYTGDAIRVFTSSAVDLGMKPAVITAIAKYHSTEMFRKVINDGMDIMGGRAIIRGKRNLLANAYFSTPISITVEGANIVTRSLIHFGQGAIMCHPYAYKEIKALEENDLKSFDQAFFAHINHLVQNVVRSILLSLSRGYLAKSAPIKNCTVKYYSKKIAWASSTFAFLSDIALAKFGGNLKRKEKLNGRFGDVLSALYIAICILKKFEEEGCQKEMQPIASYAIKKQLMAAQVAIEGIYQNMFTGFIGKLIFTPFAFFARFNAFTCPPSDKLQHEIVKDLIKNSDIRDQLTQNIYLNDDKNDNLGRIENALNIYENTLPIINKIKKAIKDGVISKQRINKAALEAKKANVISKEESAQLTKCFKVITDAMEVDDYTLADYKKV